MLAPINESNIFPIVIEYFSSLGLEKEAESFFNNKRFESSVAMVLPDVCLSSVKGSSHQSHIHVTGNNRFIFYSQKVLSEATSSIEYERRDVVLSLNNIAALKSEPIDVNKGLDNVETFTSTKYLIRTSGDVQVQISKKKNGDDPQFLVFREALKLHSLLIFLKFRGADKFYVIGIPEEFYSQNYYVPKSGSYSLHKKPIKTVSEVLSEAINSGLDNAAEVPEETDVADYIYQEEIDAVTEDSLDTPEEVYEAKTFDPSEMVGRNSSRPKTNPRIAKAELKKNEYKCFFDTAEESHKTFETPSGQNYVEAHHIIPLAQQSKFPNMLDTKANIVPLCPNCHRKIHKGTKQTVDEMLEKIFQEREKALSQSGLKVTIEELESFYHEE